MTEKIFNSKTLKRYNLNLQISDNIEDLIIKKKLKVGTKLPAERHLAEELGVNRGTLREALRLLEQKGILSIQQGRGIFVRNVSSSSIIDSIQGYYKFGGCSLEDLMTLREIMEPDIAAAAAKNASKKEIEKLENIINEIMQETNPKKYIVEDEIFHEILAESTQNKLILAIIKGLRSSLINLRQRLIKEVRKVDKEANNKVYQAIKNRDPISAKAAMLEHLKLGRILFKEIK